jgi:hydroxymethylbilane synthase
VRPSRRDIVIATRKSKLALTQSETIGRWIHRLNPRVNLRLQPMESEGDKITDHPLAALGGKGLFTRSIEQALLKGEADIAVHSYKDMPTELTTGLIVAATPAREAAHDVLISAKADDLRSLPKGATLGTCSPRRAAQAMRLRGDLKIVPMRGNVDTRVRKAIEDGEVDAVLLAAAGLKRLGLESHLAKPVPFEQVLPAAGQGALAIQCRVDDHVTLRRCLPLSDAATSTAVNAERAVAAALGADCHSPIAVLAEAAGGGLLRLRARVLSIDGKTCLEADQTGSTKKLRDLVAEVAGLLIDQGAVKVLREAGRKRE